jgi:hypothetical protein
MSEMTKAYVFDLDYEDDIKHLGEMGYPYKTAPAPDMEHVFRFWNKKNKKVAPMMKLRI